MIRISASEASTAVRSASWVKATSSPDPSERFWPSVPSAVSPSSAISGTLSRNDDTWSEIGLATSSTIVVSSATTPSITISTARPRGAPARRRRPTNGFSSSATIAPMMNRSSTRAGVDVITLGNHTYRHREIWPYLDQQPNIVRPANFLPTQPGHGTIVFERDGTSLGVVNLSGNLYMQAGSPALVTIDEALREVQDAEHVLVDMHAEATSEKVALGWHLEGRVTAV